MGGAQQPGSDVDDAGDGRADRAIPDSPDGLQPTIFQVPSILGNPEWLQAALPFLSPPRRQFFTERFPRLSEESITPVTNLIDRLRSATPLAALLGAQTSTYDIARAMGEHKIVLACPGADGARDRLVANLLVFDLLYGAKSRAFIPPEQRVPFYCFLDEIQVFDGASNGTLASLLEQTAKYGIRGFLLNQNPERLTASTLNALTTNRSHLITTALNSHAAGLISREWGGDPPASRHHRPAAPQLHRAGHAQRRADPALPIYQRIGRGRLPRRLQAERRRRRAARDRRRVRAHRRRGDDRRARHPRRADHGSPRKPPRWRAPSALGRGLRPTVGGAPPGAPNGEHRVTPAPGSECSEQGRHHPTTAQPRVRDGEL